jgi:ferredoxin
MSITRFEAALSKLSESDWNTALENARPSIHEVDRDAVKIWFSIFPLALHEHLAASEDVGKTLQGFVIQGKYKVADSLDTSHGFMYGHRYWPDVKHSISARADSFEGESVNLSEESSMIAKSISSSKKVDQDLLLGIIFVGLMSLRQTGLDEFSATPGDIAKPAGLLKKNPDQIVAARSADKKQGIFSFLRTIDKQFDVTWDERDSKAHFGVIYDEEIASGAARDHSRNWLENDPRCGEGVIPVECRSAACGTCWVGVVGGADNLSDVERLERKQMKVFGYAQEDEAKPVMRLACQARAEGNVSIVLTPWNGVFGKKIYGLEEIVLAPATSSAVKLRETISDALDSKSDNN